MPSQHRRAPLSVRLPDTEEAHLRAYAEANHMTLGETVRLAVRGLLGYGAPEGTSALSTPGTVAGSATVNERSESENAV